MSDGFIPIGILTPFLDYWCIKARITKKSQKRTYQNQRGDGSVFSVDVIDSNGSEINCSFFNKAVDKFYDELQEGQIYAFSKGRVKTSNMKYGQKNEYQIMFDERSEITKIDDEDDQIATNKFSLVKLSDIVKKSIKGQQIDVIGIIKSVSKTEAIKLKKEQNNQQSTLRKIVTLYDDSLQIIEMTLWGEHANINLNVGQIIILKEAKINEFNAVKNIQFNFNSTLITDINVLKTVPEFVNLQNWQRSVNQSTLNLTQQQQGDGFGNGPISKCSVTLQQVEDLCNKMQSENWAPDQTAFCDVIACIKYLNPDGTLYYLSCSGEKCQKKVMEQENGKFFCGTCNKEYPTAIARYTFSAQIIDDTGSQWVNFYDTAGYQLFEKQANEIRELKSQNNQEEIAHIIKNQWFRQIKFKIILKSQQYNGETKISKQIYKVEKEKDIDYKNEFKDLFAEIKKYEEQFFQV